jgi:hypothetical protein
MGHHSSAQDPDGYNKVMSTHLLILILSHTRIKSATGEKRLRRNESIERLAPSDIDLRNNHYHADEHCEDLDSNSTKVEYASCWELTSAAMIHSNIFIGLEHSGLPRASINKTSAPVIRTPAQSGRAGNRRQSAIAEPRSSARSVLMMATSESA